MARPLLSTLRLPRKDCQAETARNFLCQVQAETARNFLCQVRGRLELCSEGAATRQQKGGSQDPSVVG